MDIERLKKLIIQYRNSMTYYKNKKNAYNEQSCRDEYISPFLECLGWDVHNKKGTLPQYKEVVAEQYLNHLERPDYTLTLNGVSKLFVEAKKPSVDITTDPEPAMQARKYGWNANHAITLLTNFENLIIYDTTNQPQEGDDVNTSLYRKYNFEEYSDKFQDIYNLISEESIYSGKYDEFVKDNFQSGRIPSTKLDETFLKQLNTWRLNIGKQLYEKGGDYSNIAYLNDKVQEFINQVIFLRICEDRHLPVYQNLLETTKNKDEIKVLLLRMFQEADKRYNSGLFKDTTSIFDLSNDTIFEMIISLYSPKTPYMFSVIEPNVLGKIYEAFLTEYLICDNGMIVLAAKSDYKYKSVVTTPIEIVKYMVKTTLTPLCCKKNPEEIQKIKIIDIACGSGVFLEEAFQFLLDYCVNWYLINNPEYLIKLSNGEKKLPLVDKKKILINCIYGVDIDIHAVEVSKFSLLLKLIEKETESTVVEENPILPDLMDNIQQGNSLIEPDDIDGTGYSTEELIEMVPFDWHLINNGDMFDAVIGNPPYVKTGDMHALVGAIEYSIYTRKYKSAYQQFDKYFLFTEKALSLLKKGGKVCYIIPNKFYKIAAGKELRKLLCSRIEQIDDFGDMQLFPDKTIYSAIVLIGNEKRERLNFTAVSSVAELWSGNVGESIEISKNEMGDNPWSLSTDVEFLKVLDRLKGKTIPLSDVAEIFNGIQTSAERPEKFSEKKEVYWFDHSCITAESEEIVTIQKYGREYQIEKSILKPYYKPTKKNEKGLRTYNLLETDKRIIFPYDASGKLFDIDTMQKMYPGTLRYLTDCYDRLVPKCLNHGVGRDIPDATENTWYKYGRTQALTAFIQTPKLIVRVLSKVPMYAYDDQDMLIASGGTAGYCAISQPKDCQYELEYIQAWLAHPYTEKILQMQGSDFENGFTARGTYLLKKVPFVALDLSDHKQKAIYDDVIINTRKIYHINTILACRRDKASIGVLGDEKNRLIAKIENLITKVYQQKF
jgi:type I restriction-modification system DNA methylase subunit